MSGSGIRGFRRSNSTRRTCRSLVFAWGFDGDVQVCDARTSATLDATYCRDTLTGQDRSHRVVARWVGLRMTRGAMTGRRRTNDASCMVCQPRENQRYEHNSRSPGPPHLYTLTFCCSKPILEWSTKKCALIFFILELVTEQPGK